MGDGEALRVSARARYEHGDLEGALSAYREALALRPSDPGLLNDVGTVCFALGRAAESCWYYVKALELDSNCREARQNLEVACRAQGLSWEAVYQGVRQRLAEGPSSVAEPGSTGQRREQLFICPCCGGGFRSFLPAGPPGRKRPNRRCPGCGSLERHRALWLYMGNRTNLLSAQLRLLHFAPSAALQRLLSAMPNLHYVTADLNMAGVSLKMDITDILFRDGVFDAILCVHVLEHVAGDRQALREMLRVLKPGGWAIIHSPVDRERAETFEDASIVSPQDRERYYGQKDHVRVYGRDYGGRLEEAGFLVTVDEYLRGLGPVVARRHLLGQELEVHYCVKPVARG